MVARVLPVLIVQKIYIATKAPRHQVAQSVEYQSGNLGESFVSWCLGGRNGFSE
jgi:hypothetical protein